MSQFFVPVPEERWKYLSKTCDEAKAGIRLWSWSAGHRAQTKQDYSVVYALLKIKSCILRLSSSENMSSGTSLTKPNISSCFCPFTETLHFCT